MLSAWLDRAITSCNRRNGEFLLMLPATHSAPQLAVSLQIDNKQNARSGVVGLPHLWAPQHGCSTHFGLGAQAK
jgi:hypothetical protein